MSHSSPDHGERQTGEDPTDSLRTDVFTGIALIDITPKQANWFLSQIYSLRQFSMALSA